MRPVQGRDAPLGESPMAQRAQLKSLGHEQCCGPDGIWSWGALLIVNFALSKPAGIELTSWVANYPGLRSVWLLVVGSLAVVAGFFLAFWGNRHRG